MPPWFGLGRGRDRFARLDLETGRRQSTHGLMPKALR